MSVPAETPEEVKMGPSSTQRARFCQSTFGPFGDQPDLELGIEDAEHLERPEQVEQLEAGEDHRADPSHGTSTSSP